MDSELRERQKITSNEPIKNDVARYKFEYLSDKRFQNSPIMDGVLKLDLPKTTTETTIKIVKDLKIGQPITISTRIPTKNESSFIIPTLGIGGWAFSESEIFLFFDLNNPNVIESLKKYRNPQIAHELIHVARIQAGQKNRTLLDKIINEGLATYYEEMWEDKRPTPWGNALKPEQESVEWKKAESQLELSVSEDWFFGKDKKHPFWTGYTLGNSILKSYFKRHPNEKMCDVVVLDSKKILEESRYHSLP